MCDGKPAEIGDGGKRSTLTERAAAEREPSPTRLDHRLCSTRRQSSARTPEAGRHWVVHRSNWEVSGRPWFGKCRDGTGMHGRFPSGAALSASMS
jgi:hypothetical protein